MTDIPEHLGPLRHTYRHDQLDAILGYGLALSDVETTRSLMSSKWWDYRFVHPGYAFLKFADLYADAVDNWCARFGVTEYSGNPFGRNNRKRHPLWHEERVIGSTRAHTECVLNPAIFRTGLWRSMCLADSYGVSYDHWVNCAFEMAFTCKWQRIPLPTMLSGVDMADYILRRWAEVTEALMVTAKDPVYRVENYEGHPWQDAHRAWLLDLVAARPRPEFALARYLSEEPLLTIEAAERKLSPEVIQRAVELL